LVTLPEILKDVAVFLARQMPQIKRLNAARDKGRACQPETFATGGPRHKRWPHGRKEPARELQPAAASSACV